MFSFLPLTNSSITVELNSLLVIISNHVIKDHKYFVIFSWIVLLNIFINILQIICVFNKRYRIIKISKSTFFCFLIKNLYFALYGSFLYRYINIDIDCIDLSISEWRFIKLNNIFVFLTKMWFHQKSVILYHHYCLMQFC